jgi:hypothetical protein
MSSARIGKIKLVARARMASVRVTAISVWRREPVFLGGRVCHPICARTLKKIENSRHVSPLILHRADYRNRVRFRSILTIWFHRIGIRVQLQDMGLHPMFRQVDRTDWGRITMGRPAGSGCSARYYEFSMGHSSAANVVMRGPRRLNIPLNGDTGATLSRQASLNSGDPTNPPPHSMPYQAILPMSCLYGFCWVVKIRAEEAPLWLSKTNITGKFSDSSWSCKRSDIQCL